MFVAKHLGHLLLNKPDLIVGDDERVFEACDFERHLVGGNTALDDLSGLEGKKLCGANNDPGRNPGSLEGNFVFYLFFNHGIQSS